MDEKLVEKGLMCDGPDEVLHEVLSVFWLLEKNIPYRIQKLDAVDDMLLPEIDVKRVADEEFKKLIIKLFVVLEIIDVGFLHLKRINLIHR